MCVVAVVGRVGRGREGVVGVYYKKHKKKGPLWYLKVNMCVVLHRDGGGGKK